MSLVYSLYRVYRVYSEWNQNSGTKTVTLQQINILLRRRTAGRLASIS